MPRPADVIHLSRTEIPTRWYNLAADLPTPPPLHPGTRQPATAQDMSAIFPDNIIEQEMSTERWIDIPEEVLDAYAIWRPTPLFRARRLEAALGTTARIYYKYEGVSPAGSHKTNTAVPQAYYNKQAGVKRMTTETGAGQWGAALSFACQRYGLGCTVYMVRVSYEGKPYRRTMMNMWGGEVFASPTDRTKAGRHIRERMPDTLGSLGIAISEAVEDAVSSEDTKYGLGSVLNHVMLHQSVIGQETQKQLESIGEKADVLVGCVGGGSNFAGLTFPFLADKISGKDKDLRVVAVEPSACPTITRGRYEYDFGDTEGLTPLLKMHTLGHDFVPPGIHSGGLRYHGMGPLVSSAVEAGLVEGISVHQLQVFDACKLFLTAEGILPAPESGHAILGAIEEAKRMTAEGRKGAIVFNLSGHGFLDLAAYQSYVGGELVNYDFDTGAPIPS
ncbi:MAG: tryptophan synthase beta chain [Candidatus Sumerlaeota bacterium]|nr:tryptophan synthase beta chain [Candidatus Sumerlaeota bacterium]